MQQMSSCTSNAQSCDRSTTPRSSHPRIGVWRPVRWPIWLAASLFSLALPGCGANLNEALYQTTAAAGRTLLDLWLTNLANRLADASAQDDTPTPDGDQNGGDNGAPDGGPPAGDGFDELTGDPAAGEALYTANSCAACHCADAGGGCLPDAPALVGLGAETLDERLRGDATHMLKLGLTNQEIVDLQAYLASFGG